MYTSTTEFAKLIAKKLNLKITKDLGGGGQGTAHLLKDGRVMKVTEQESEYYTSTERIGKSHPNICEIFETYRVSYDGEECFAIIQERLNTSCYKALKEFEDATDMQRYARALVRDSEHPETNRNIEKLREDKWIMDNYSEFIDMYENLVDASIEIGIESSDVYCGNIGKRGKEWVLFDLGYNIGHSSSEGQELNLTPEYVIPKGDKLKKDLLKLKQEHGSALIREAGIVMQGHKLLGNQKLFRYIK